MGNQSSKKCALLQEKLSGFSSMERERLNTVFEKIVDSQGQQLLDNREENISILSPLRESLSTFFKTEGHLKEKEKGKITQLSFINGVHQLLRSSVDEKCKAIHSILSHSQISLKNFVQTISLTALHFWTQEKSFTNNPKNMTPEHFVNYILLYPFLKLGEPEDATEQGTWLTRCEGSLEYDSLYSWFQKNGLFQRLLEVALTETFIHDPTTVSNAAPDIIAQTRSKNLIIPAVSCKSHLLKPSDMWFLNQNMPIDCRQRWDLLFSSKVDGKSWSTFQSRIEGMGSLLIIIKEKGSGEHIFGGFVYEPLELKPRFYGCSDNFLFTINPNMRVYSTSRYNENFQYFNFGTKTLPNGFGMGGQYDYFGLWINSDFETGHSKAGPFCSTYNSTQLSRSEYFDIDEVEVFCVKEIERDPNLLPPKRSAMDTNADAVALLEMANRKMYSKDLREPDLGLDDSDEE